MSELKRNLTSVRLQSFRTDCNQVETWLPRDGAMSVGSTKLIKERA